MRIVIAALLSIFLFEPVVFAAEADNPRVLLETNMGNIVIELFEDEAPITVANFLDYVNSGFYDGLIFHRVIQNFMIQGGGFDVNLQYRQGGDPIENESYNGLSNLRGTIAMARTSDPHSATSQFFINHANNPGLDKDYLYGDGWGYCVFGQVESGMDVVDAIAALQTVNDMPINTVIIERARIVIFVSPSGSDTTGKGTVAEPFATIGKGMDVVRDYGHVVVGQGVYYENINFAGRDIVVRSSDTYDQAIIEATVIDGGGTEAVVTFSGGETAAAQLCGLTLRNGNASEGGGISGNGTAATVSGNIITDNQATSGGGTANCAGAVTNNIIEYNNCSTSGAGVYNCDTVVQNVIRHNNSAARGGGLSDCLGTIRNNVIWNNSAAVQGGGINNCQAAIEMNTIVANSSAKGGGLCDCGGTQIVNCIIRDNTAATGAQIYDNGQPAAEPVYCCIEGFSGGMGNIDVDPLFADAADGDFHLKSEGWRWDDQQESWTWDQVTSRCVGAGSPGYQCYNIAWPFDNVRVNMGAFGGTARGSIAPHNWSYLGDLNNDGVVNAVDYATMLGCMQGAEYEKGADLTRNGQVDMLDMAVVIDEWLSVASWHE